MAIHIGKVIRDRVKESRLTNRQIAEKINRVEGTLYDIYKRETIDTDTLLKLCEVLQFDFFALYYNEDPLRRMQNKNLEKILTENSELKSELEIKNDYIKDLTKIIAVQKERIKMMEQNK